MIEFIALVIIIYAGVSLITRPRGGVTLTREEAAFILSLIPPDRVPEKLRPRYKPGATTDPLFTAGLRPTGPAPRSPPKLRIVK